MIVIPKKEVAAPSFNTPPTSKMLPVVPKRTEASLLAEFGRQSIQVKAKVIGAVRFDQTQGIERGIFCQLPLGSIVTFVGCGFSGQTVLIRHKEAIYIVFRQDLGLPVSGAIGPSKVS